MINAMKTIIHLLLLATCRGQEFECPRGEGEVCLDGNYPNPNDCTTYYICNNCQLTDGQCPPDQHFDPYLETCLPEEQAWCDGVFIGDGSAICLTGLEAEGPESPLVYPSIIINHNYPYHTLLGQYRAEFDGIFFFHLSAGAYPAKRVDLKLNVPGVTRDYAVVRNSEAHEFDVLSKDVLVQLNIGDILSTEISEGTNVFDDVGRPTLWAGFSLQQFMDNVIAFSAVSDNYVIQYGPILYEIVMFNVDSILGSLPYDAATGTFTAPVDGTYYFSASTGTPPHGHHRSRFETSYQGSEPQNVCELWRGIGENQGIDTLSKSVLINLRADETVHMALKGGEMTNYPDSTIINFIGFLYQPKAPTPKVAWSVHATSIADASVGSVDPVQFPVVTVNEGSIFNDATQQVTIETSGYYFISVSAGAVIGQPVQLELLVDGDIEMDVRRTLGYQPYEDTLSRSIMLQLTQGSILRMRAAIGTQLYSDSDRQTSWSGFLLHATTG